ncbi:MAG TPA: hypothetical protein VER04_06555 [Polyangiaceae bacterium]|nr:hypothetical protein [Polyangiaceae bacterium]
MRHGGLAWALAPLPALTFGLACVSCSAPATCDAQALTQVAVESEVLSGSFLLSEASKSQTLRFRASLLDVPELWTSFEAVEYSTLPLELGVLYEREPFGGDGHTEMPPLLVSFGEPAAGGSGLQGTGSYPGPMPDHFSAGLFQDCAFGSQTCQTVFPVRIERSAGAPFPPVRVSWRASVNARINVCSALASHTRATLEVETP